MQASNLEPRRHWRMGKWHDLRSHLLEIEHLLERCRSCRAVTSFGEWRGEWFCHECLEHSSQECLDPEYDDLGGSG